MSVLDALILGFIQGATEFLPVSSSGHLVMGQVLLGIRIPGVGFEVALHVATLVSVLLVYRGRVTGLAGGAIRGERDAWRYLGLLVLATVPAAIVGLGLSDVVEAAFDTPAVVGGALLVTGSFLWTARKALARNPTHRPGPWSAFLIGVAQMFALVPGISRSGITVVTALWLGIEPQEAAAFSFLMAVPAILGAAVLELPTLAEGGAVSELSSLLLGSAVAAVTGILAIWIFVRMLRHRSFHRFGPYCWSVGGLFLIYLLVRG